MNEKELSERLDLLEFRQELLFYNSELSRLLFEYKIKRSEYNSIMDIMDWCREKIAKEGKDSIEHNTFEEKIYDKVDSVSYGDYHFCEYIAKAFMDEGRWEEVFPAIYGSLPKYKNFMDEYSDE